MIPITHGGYKLFQEGMEVLSRVEAAGIRIDRDYLINTSNQTTEKIRELTKRLKQDPIFKVWKKQFGSQTNIGSRMQLGEILFNILKHPCKQRTASGRPAVDEHALEGMDLDFTRQLLKIEKLKKARTTYLQGILREVGSDGRVHPFFHLHLVDSFRSSSSSPSFQNIPVRDKGIAALIRKAFLPSSNNHCLVEADFSGIEVRVSACYNHDPKLISYIEDKTKDMHRDMAMQCYILKKKKQVTKEIRYCGKNKFVFPQFYGDYYLNCAAALWEAIGRMKLVTADGTPLKKHLKKQGISRLGKCDPEEKPVPGTFEYHIQQIEKDFWQRRFKVYTEWKRKWWDSYREKGYIDTLTGFRITGLFRRNVIINIPIQGSAFHCLLWCLIQISKEMRKRKMRSLIVGQIHDSIVADIHKSELVEYIQLVREVMTKRLSKHWQWIIVPIEVEIEVAPPGLSWFEKKLITI